MCVNREFEPDGGRIRTWTADITYVATGEGWLYLAAVEDLHSQADRGMVDGVADR